ncbi:MAG: winged helix-turn-helix transcriptional regulator [Acidimicrobiia bacterium]
MPIRKSLDHLQCSVANTAELIGDRWTVLILRDAFLGVRRFDGFQRDLGIARNVLTDRLALLVDSGILVTRQYEEHPPRFEYLLSQKGKDLFDVLVAMWRWGDRWNPPIGVSLRTLRHLDCGSEVHGEIRCEECGGQLHPRNTWIDPPLQVVAERLPAAAG